MISEEHLDILRRAVDQWNRAEAVIKNAETIRGEVVIPSINELRYAGRRLADAILVAGSASLDVNRTRDDQIRSFALECEQFCIRAQHDAIDSSILFIKKHIMLFDHTFGQDLIASKYHQYYELRSALDEIDGLITDSRGERTRRLENYANIVDIRIPRIKSLYESMCRSEGMLVLAREKALKTAYRDKIVFWSGIASLIIGVLSIVVSAAGLANCH